MKKQIITGIAVIGCAALCAAVWPRSVKVEDLPAEPIKAAVTAEIEARLEETQHISADVPTPVREPGVKSAPQITEVKAEKETATPAPTSTAQPIKPAASSAEPFFCSTSQCFEVVIYISECSASMDIEHCESTIVASLS